MIFSRYEGVYDIDHVSTYDEAIERVTQGDYDLYLVDYFLDRGNTGDSLIDEAARRSLPAIMITGVDDDKLRARIMRAGASDCISKDNLNSNTLHEVASRALSTLDQFQSQTRH